MTPILVLVIDHITITKTIIKNQQKTSQTTSSYNQNQYFKTSKTTLSQFLTTMDLQHLSQPQPTLTSQLPSQPHSFQKVRLQLSSKYHTIEFMASLDITENEMSFAIEQELSDEGKQVEKIQEEGKHMIVGFGNVSGVGLQAQKVMVFLEDQNQQGEEEQEEWGQQQGGEFKPMSPQYQNTGHPLPSIFKHLKLSQTCHVNLHGNYTLSLTFDTEQTRLKAHELLTNYLKSQQQSQSQQEFPLGQMISAEDINEDGTINKINHSGDEQQSLDEQQQENEK